MDEDNPAFSMSERMMPSAVGERQILVKAPPLVGKKPRRKKLRRQRLDRIIGNATMRLARPVAGDERPDGSRDLVEGLLTPLLEARDPQVGGDGHILPVGLA